VNWQVSGCISVGWWGSSLSALGCMSHASGTEVGGVESERENYGAELRAAVWNRFTETCFTFHHNVNSSLSLHGMPFWQLAKCVTWQCMWFWLFSCGTECWEYLQNYVLKSKWFNFACPSVTQKKMRSHVTINLLYFCYILSWNYNWWFLCISSCSIFPWDFSLSKMSRPALQFTQPHV